MDYILNIQNPYYDNVYYSYSDLTSLGLSSGKWIIIEPQSPIEYQGEQDWFKQRSITDALEIS